MGIGSCPLFFTPHLLQRPALPMKRSFLRVLFLCAAVMLAYYAVLLVFQRRLIFPAPRGASTVAMAADVQRDSLRLEFGAVPIWYLPPLDSTVTRARTILYAHGNGERAEDWLNAFRTPRLAGYGVAVMEFPGYGEAAGAPSEATITTTALAAYDWLASRSDVDSAQIVLLGRSLGGGAMAKVAARRPVRALVLESSFASLRELAGRVLAPAFLVRDPFDTRAELSTFKSPLLLIHGLEDEIAPFSHAESLAELVPGALLVPLTCGHNDCTRPWNRILTFLDALPSGAPR
jgi:pimeloyl-ACP methyl ester carboxylesterase